MKELFHKLFLHKTSNARVQFFRYFFSGGSAFLVYFALLFVLTEFFYIYHLWSLVIAYVFSIAVNFLISKYFVFSGEELKGNGKSSKQFMKFFGVALIGLCLQYLIVSFLSGSGMQYLFANVIASATVYVVSFSLNRWFTFRA